MSKKLLSESATVTKYYDKMSLTDATIREVFVTMMLAVSPELIKAIESALKIALERASDKTEAPLDEQRFARTLSILSGSGDFSRSEVLSVIESKTGSEYTSGNNRNSIQTTPTEMITPDDSASNIGGRSPTTIRASDRDLISYAKRRSSGNERDFNRIFTNAQEPIQVLGNKGRSGLGFKQKFNSISELTAQMNKVLGSATQVSYNHRTGEKNIRQPRVEDFLESESIAPSVLKQVPDSASNVFSGMRMNNVAKPVPTESYLPNSVIKEPYNARFSNSSVDSLEELRRGRMR